MSVHPDSLAPASTIKVSKVSRAAPTSDALTEQILALWRRVLVRRAPEVAAQLDASPVAPLPAGKQAIPYLQALNIRFQLLRIVDENAAMRDRRAIETAGGEAAVPESFARLLDSGMTRETMSELAAQTLVGPTLTAHPTETKRVTVLEIHRRIYRGLVALETDRWTPREREDGIDAIENQIDLLWMTGELRLDRPTPDDEISWGLHFFSDILFDVVPQVFSSLNRAMHAGGGAEDSGQEVECRPRLSFHSWIGGDRDGNPQVTTAVTRRALASGRQSVMARYDAMLEDVAAQLSISNRIAPLDEAQSLIIQDIIGREQTAPRNPNEWFRQALSAIRRKMSADRYLHVSDFMADIRAIEQALCSLDAARLAHRYLRPIRWFAEVFGFRTVTLDIRQNSTVTNTALREIWEVVEGPVPPDYGTPGWSSRLRTELVADTLPPLNRDRLSEQTLDLIDLLTLMHEVISGPDPQAVGPFILSMTKSADDLLGVLLLARHAGFDRETPEIALVPLFETIADLRAAAEIIRQVVEISSARRCMTRRGRAVEIMLGYSDSNKDGGFLCSSWEVHCAQSRLVATLGSLGLNVTFFHGRGGSVSRGGAPTNRAIAAQPPGTIGRCIRLTEQGEVVSARYANRGSAATHLELLVSSALEHRWRKPDREVVPEHENTLAALAGLSQTAYTKLINSDGFLDYFQEASPVEELANLKIGSRPARRFGASTLDDLRAIPWVFAWSQNRHLLTGWYGFGSAVESFVGIRGESGLALLRDMFRHSDFFRLVVDETEKTLFQTDLTIAAHYASLVRSADTRERILVAVRSEYDKSVAAIRQVGECDSLADRFPDFRRQFDRYARDLDRVHLLQIELLREARQHEKQSPSSIALLQSMNCISSALGWTG